MPVPPGTVFGSSAVICVGVVTALKELQARMCQARMKRGYSKREGNAGSSGVKHGSSNIDLGLLTKFSQR